MVEDSALALAACWIQSYGVPRRSLQASIVVEWAVPVERAPNANSSTDGTNEL